MLRGFFVNLIFAIIVQMLFAEIILIPLNQRLALTRLRTSGPRVLNNSGEQTNFLKIKITFLLEEQP